MVIITIITLIKSRYEESGMDLLKTPLADTRAFFHSILISVWSFAFSLYYLWPQTTLSTWSLFHYSHKSVLSFLYVDWHMNN